MMQREYEEFKVRVNGLVAKAQKIPEEGWIMQDGTPWPGNNTRDHPGMIQVVPFRSCLFLRVKKRFIIPLHYIFVFKTLTIYCKPTIYRICFSLQN